MSSSEVPTRRYPDGVNQFISPFLSHQDTNTALVVLNSPISSPPSPLFDHLWNISSYRVCADGGANRLFKATESSRIVTSTLDSAKLTQASENVYIPDRIRGDLDSLFPHVREHYKSLGTIVDRDPDQNTNDLDKSLSILAKEWLKTKRVDDEEHQYRVCIYGAFGGRFDQEMGCIQALYKWGTTFRHQLFLVDDHTCAFFLPAETRNEIRLSFYGEAPTANETDKTLIGEGPTCGLIPVGAPCRSMTTTGLKWNLQGDASEFGGLVSTSNRVMEEVVVVESSDPLIFTAEMTCGT